MKILKLTLSATKTENFQSVTMGLELEINESEENKENSVIEAQDYLDHEIKLWFKKRNQTTSIDLVPAQSQTKSPWKKCQPHKKNYDSSKYTGCYQCKQEQYKNSE